MRNTYSERFVVIDNLLSVQVQDTEDTVVLHQNGFLLN